MIFRNLFNSSSNKARMKKFMERPNLPSLPFRSITTWLSNEQHSMDFKEIQSLCRCHAWSMYMVCNMFATYTCVRSSGSFVNHPLWVGIFPPFIYRLTNYQLSFWTPGQTRNEFTPIILKLWTFSSGSNKNSHNNDCYLFCLWENGCTKSWKWSTVFTIET
jgi:hypothetical protein